MIHCGHYDGQPVALQDAQGRAIPVLCPEVGASGFGRQEWGRDTVEKQRCPF